MRATAPSARQLAAVELLSSYGVTPVAGGAAPFDARRFELGPDGSTVGGFIPGRHPILRSELVVVQAAIGDSSVAMVMEAVRALVARSQTENIPGRSVLVAIVPDAAQGAMRALWPASSVHAEARQMPSTLNATRFEVSWPGGERREEVWLRSDVPVVQRSEEVLRLVLHLASPADTLGHDEPDEAQIEVK